VTRLHGERGSLAIELAFIAPVFLLLLSLVYAYARVAQVNGTLEAATRDAARTASQARTVEEAEQRVEVTVLDALGRGAPTCRDTLETGVLGLFQAGVPVRVKARCQYSMQDLGLPGFPGDVTVSSTFTSPIDPQRGTEPGTRPADLP